MTPNSGRTIEVFTEAIQLPIGERAAFLDRACGEDEELRQNIEALLKSHDRAGGFLEQPPSVELGEGRTKAAVGEKPGDTIDRYRLLQQIGEGGCGVVFVAEQQEPVLRRVALKLIKPGMDTKSVIARFEAERQALALMEHPNIAHVFDAGATESGRPYFVMELVEGFKITDYCDRHSLPLRARLELFRQVCDAIQHAHQKGVIHRDIKPSNVLVTTGPDGKPTPKVIDFGIAKATDGQQLTDKTIFTACDMLIGTPAYMSPEQAALSSAELDTRTDIYSLGVLLYELLTGKTPFDTREILKVGFDEVRRVIRDQEPVRPSTRLRAMVPADLMDISKHHGTEMPKLIREMRGDLDLVVMKALEKDRTRRYATANGLAMDVERYLAGEAISARPPSVWYQLRKLAQRNRLLVGGLSIVAAMFVVGFVAVTVAFTREKAARQEADKARQQAETDKINSQQVTSFLEAMLEGVGPSVALGRDTALLKEILDRTATRLDKELKNQPAVQVELRTRLAMVYREIRQNARSEAMLREQLAASTRIFGEESNPTADVAFELAMTLYVQSKSAEAETLMRRALAVRQKLLGETNIKIAKCYESLGWIYGARQQLPEAEAMLRKSLTMLRQLYGDDDPALGNSLLGLGSAVFSQGKYREAEELFRQAMSVFKKVKDEDHPTVARCMYNLATALTQLQKYAEAEGLIRRAVAAHRKVLGEDHELFALSLQQLTVLLNRANRFDEAEVAGREALGVARKVWGDTRAETLRTIRELVDALQRQQKFEEIERLFAEVLAPEGELKPEHAGLLKDRCEFRARRGRWRGAADDAMVLVKLAPDNHENYHTLAPLLVQLGDLAEYQRLCGTILDKFSGTTDMFVADRMAKDCLILPSSGVDLRAVGALADLAVSRGSNSSAAPYFQFCKALAEFRLGNYEEAVNWARLAAKGPFDYPKADAAAIMAMSRFELDQLDKAQTALADCNQVIGGKLPQPEQDLSNDWRDWIIAHALRNEAKSLIEGDAKPDKSSLQK